jgi:hypothetical protein
VTNRLKVMAVESSSLGRRIGILAGYRAEDAVTTAFDGLRFLHEQIMVSKPHSRLLKKQGVQAMGSGCYHGGGLYLTDMHQTPQFVLPLVFHRPSGWCCKDG